MLSLSEISKSYAGRVLFEKATLQINRGERIGLVGPNGAGKTTLFRIILGQESPDSGRAQLERGITFGWLPQESAPVGEETVMELATQHAEPEQRWEHEARAKIILRGLAFRESDFTRSARTLSGGWVMRAHLARLLVQQPDLLMLDEPTNHLDLESLVWFREYLKTYPGAIVMISHDRDFLNQLVKKVVEIAFSRLNFYTGNYDDYLREREVREQHQAAIYQNQVDEIARLQSFVDRFGAKATKATQAQSRVKQIEKLREDMVEAPQSRGKSVRFRFPQPARSGQRTMKLTDIHFAYGEQPVYQGLNFEVERGQRTVLVGPNGAGKSTLLKLLAGQLTAQSGERLVGHNVNVGYFSQNRVEMLDPFRTVLQEGLAVEARPPEQFVRNILGSFLFSGEAVDKPVAVLSGGEKSRLALAKLLLDPPNFLLMDEPTTHLDIPSIDALVGALEQFEGTLVFISHDVHFIRALAKQVVRISAGELTSYAGDYQYYLDKTGATNARTALVAGQMLTDLRAGESTDSGEKKGEKIFLTREEKKAAAAAREAQQVLKRAQKKKVDDLEAKVLKVEARAAELTAELEKPETYEKSGRAMDLNRDLMRVQDDIARLTAAWEHEAEVLAGME